MSVIAAARAQRGSACTDQAFHDEVWLLSPRQAYAPPLLLLGGMGPQVGLRAFAQACARSAQSRKIVLVQACSTPDRTEAVRAELAGEAVGAIARAGVIQALTTAVQRAWQVAGAPAEADLIVLCNTAHHFLANMRLPSPIRLIHLVDAAARRCSGMSEVIVLSTFGTRTSGLYARSLAQWNVRCLTPPVEAEALLTDMVYRGIKAVNPNYALNVLPDLLDKLARWAPHADALICGCTEIPLVLAAAPDIRTPWPLIDPLACAVACLEDHEPATASSAIPQEDGAGY
jgi:aspartate/glutamate racemase